MRQRSLYSELLCVSDGIDLIFSCYAVKNLASYDSCITYCDNIASLLWIDVSILFTQLGMISDILHIIYTI